jgi:Ca2+-binding RTX toxin-like protein
MAMTTLTVTTTHDFTGDNTLVGIGDIVFDNTTASVLVTFSASQFNFIQISDSVNITGDADQNVIVVNLNTAHTFDASGWNVSSWTGQDFVEIDGSSGADTITGPSAAGGFVYLRGGAGADIIYGGNAINIFAFNAGDIKAGDTVFGGAAQDSINPAMDGSTYDFRLVEMSSVNVLDLNRGLFGTSSKVILDGDQIGAGAITTIFGSNNNWTSNVLVQGQTVDLSAVQFFFWTDGEDTLRVLGTKGADDLTGSIKIDTLVGGRGHDLFTGGLGDDVFDFNSKFDSLRGAKRDVISDFGVGDNVAGGLEDDLIDLKTIDANSLRAGNQHFKFVSKFHHKAGELDVKQDLAHNTTIVQGDIDGNGRADFQIELTGLLSLSKLDFIL